MVAGVLAKFGFFMGEAARSPVFESVLASDIFLGRSDRKARALVADLNSKHPLWAWKRPAAVYELTRTIKRMQPARVIMVFRDPLATAARRSMAVGDLKVESVEKLTEHFQMVLNEYNELLALTSALQVPFAMVSYDTALQDPAGFVQQMTHFLGINPDSEELASAIAFIQPSPTDYLMSLKEHEFKGVLDGVDTASIWGWAKPTDLETDGPVEVEILVNGKKVTSLLADQHRQDLSRKGIGNCAFKYELETPLPFGAEVRVRVVGDDLELRNSPKIYQA